MAKWTIRIEYEVGEHENGFNGYWFAEAVDEDGFVVEEFEGLETNDLEKLVQSVTERIQDKIESLSGLIPQLKEKAKLKAVSKT